MYPDSFKIIRSILASDVRFSKPTVTDDQVWRLTIEPGIPLSLSSTYGLRAKRISIFPEFTCDNVPVSDSNQFHQYPRLEFQSTNFSELAFSPFPNIDARLKIWVPTSQIIIGQIACINTSEISRRVNMDWLVRLDPLPNGRPMSPEQIGLNMILQGNTGDLFPVFYLTGGPKESPSAFPGLTINMLLIPGSSRQVTWVLASHTSTDLSFQQARHYSSHQLDVEQLKIEMADKRQKCIYKESDDDHIPAMLNQSQNQSYQLLMPSVRQLKHSTFIHERNTDHGSYKNEELLEINPEWSGQTLPEIWILTQNLLPGRPETVKELIQNILDSQTPDGWIDYRVGANHKHTGVLAPPMLAALVCELHPLLEDFTWLEHIYPKLIRFFKRWFETGSDQLPELVHPIQTGLTDWECLPAESLVSLWGKLKSSQNPLVLSLFYHETRSLIQIAGWLKTGEDLPWLDRTRIMLEKTADILWNDSLAVFDYQDQSSGFQYKGKQLCSFKKSGVHKPVRKIVSPGRLFIQLNISSRLSPDFSLKMCGAINNQEVELSLSQSSFQWLGTTGFFITENAFSSLDSIEIGDWQKGDTGSVGQADLQQPDIFSYLPLWAGIPSSQQVEKMLASENIEKYMTCDGISLTPQLDGKPSIRIPNFLAAMLIQGCIQYQRFDMALRLFQCHFNYSTALNYRDSVHPASYFEGSLENLLPVLLFLQLCGIRKVTPSEVIITHFNIHQHTVTVQYNQIKLILNSNKTEIIPDSGSAVVLDKVGPHRIIFDK